MTALMKRGSHVVTRPSASHVTTIGVRAGRTSAKQVARTAGLITVAVTGTLATQMKIPDGIGSMDMGGALHLVLELSPPLLHHLREIEKGC